jgi:hypothetical protein
VALSEEMRGADGSAPEVVGAVGGGKSAASRKSRLTQVAASGAFLTTPASVRRGAGVWGRAWQCGKLAAEDAAEGVSIGAPLLVDGAVVGLLGVVVPAGRDGQTDFGHDVALVADMGSAALQRLSGRAV